MAEDSIPEYGFAKALGQLESFFLDGNMGVFEAIAKAAIRMAQNVATEDLPRFRSYAQEFRSACLSRRIASHPEKNNFFRMLDRIINAIPGEDGQPSNALQKTVHDMVLLFCQGRMPEFHQLAFGLQLHGMGAIAAINKAREGYPTLAKTIGEKRLFELDRMFSSLVMQSLLEAEPSKSPKGKVTLSQPDLVMAVFYLAKLISQGHMSAADNFSTSLKSLFPGATAHVLFLKRQFILQYGLDIGSVDLALIDSLERYLVSDSARQFSSYYNSKRNDYEIALDMLFGLYLQKNYEAAKPIEERYLWTGSKGAEELAKAIKMPAYSGVKGDFEALSLRIKDYISDIPPSKSFLFIRKPRQTQTGTITAPSQFINGGKVKIHLN
jgi:hypothetical protein